MNKVLSNIWEYTDSILLNYGLKTDQYKAITAYRALIMACSTYLAMRREDKLPVKLEEDLKNGMYLLYECGVAKGDIQKIETAYYYGAV